MNIISIITNAGNRILLGPALIFLTLFSFPIKAMEKYVVPDFAFPKTVEADSEKLLNESLEAHDDLMTLRATMNLLISRQLLADSQNARPAILLIDSIAAELNYPFRQLAYLLESKVLYETYESDSYVYDHRNLPVSPIPDDTEEWSSPMFKQSILNLIELATTPCDSIEITKDALPISSIELLLSNVKDSEKLGLTVPQFIALKAVDLLKNISPQASDAIIPFFPSETQETIEGKCRLKKASLLRELASSLSGNNSIVKALALKEICSSLDDDKKEKFLKKAVQELTGTEGEGLLLYQLWNTFSPDSDEEASTILGRMTSWLEKFPDGFSAYNIDYAIAEITKKNIGITFEKKYLPEKPISFKVNVGNINTGYILIYRLNEEQVDHGDYLIFKNFNPSSRPLLAIPFNHQGKVPFTYEEKLEVPPLSPGIYAAVPSETSSLPSSWRKKNNSSAVVTFRVTDIELLTTFDSQKIGSGRVYVVRASDQKPVAGATVTYFKGDSSKAVSRLFTNKDGYVSIPEGYYRIEASYGKNKASKSAGFSYNPGSESTRYYASIITDLAVYRPGDTVKFSVVGWSQNSNTNSIVTEDKVKVTLLDANHSKVAEINLELNAEGRASGEFIIPEGRLLGTYRLSASYPDYPSSPGGEVRFLVEEYKLPPFMVTLSQEDSESEDTVKFTGSALTYAGLPVTDAKVAVTVKFMPWRWGYLGSNASYSLEVNTDSQGVFQFSLPLNNLKGTLFESGRYMVTAAATSLAGETEESEPLFFYLGTGLEIRPAIPAEIKVDGDFIKFNVPVYDQASLPVAQKVKYTIVEAGNPENKLEGSFMSPNLILPASSIPSGKYNLIFDIESDKTSQQEMPVSYQGSNTQTVIWHDSDTKVPYPTPLWIPETSLTYSPGQSTVEIKFGSFWNDWILCAVSDSEKVYSIKWIAPSDFMRKETVDIPSSETTLFVTLAGLHDFNSETAQIKIKPWKALETMKIQTESFRENISAGMEEHWKFRFNIDNHPASFVKAFAVMTDKALNAISDFKWRLNIWSPSPYSKFRLSSSYNSFSFASAVFLDKKEPTYRSYSIIPDWETYGYQFVSFPVYDYDYAPLAYKTMATRNMNASMEIGAMDFAEESSVELPAAEVAQDDSDSVEKNQEQLRPVEMPLAFFFSDLKGDENGVVTIDFKVPDFNTTWQFQLAGYNDELLNATTILDAVASKPVIVKSSLPRFLRTGDVAQVSATIYNNSDEKMEVGGKILVINPLTGNTLSETQIAPVLLEPSGNKVISLDFTVPDNLTSLTVRAYAFSENHSDGEQGFIPVLPSSTPVVEATTFYAGSKETSIEVKLPKLDKNANVVLKYCDNPLWEVLLSLPAITSSENSGAISLARGIYGNLTSSGIILGHPEIALGLDAILHSSDSILSTSRLEQDENVKIVGLQATPWLLDASSATEEIRSLAGYLDAEKVDEKVNAQIRALSKLQNSNGGWSWFEGFSSSPFITREVVKTLGYLNRQKQLPEELEGMALNGIRYYDSWLVECWENEKHPSLPVMIDYLYSRSMFDYPMNDKLDKISVKTLEEASKEWRHWSEGDKAKAALLMLTDERFHKEALLVASSLGQLLQKRKPLLDEAFMLELAETIDSSSPMTESITESILLKKETEDWNASYNVAALSYILIKALGDSVPDRSKPEIYLDGEKLSLPETQVLTGNFTLDLDPGMATGKNLKITRQEGRPAWGGIVSQYIVPIKNVKKAEVENLSIEKRIFVEDAKGNLKEIKNVRKGDKVKVVLTISNSKVMDYIAIADSRAACLQPDDKLSGLTFIDGLPAYREIRTDKVSFFIERLPAGKHQISYDCHVERDGEYSQGIAEVQCLYSPAQVAHSAGNILTVKQ